MVALLAGEAGQMTAYEGTFPDRLRFVTVKTGKNRPDLAQHWSGTREELFELISCGPGEQRELLTRAQRLLHAWRNHDEARSGVEARTCCGPFRTGSARANGTEHAMAESAHETCSFR